MQMSKKLLPDENYFVKHLVVSINPRTFAPTKKNIAGWSSW